MKCPVEMGSGGIKNVPSSMTIGSNIEVTLGYVLNNLKGCNFGITDGRDF
jgi:hypothetical protein